MAEGTPYLVSNDLSVTGGGVLRLVAERMAVGGEAVARDADGRTVLVSGALPGEEVEALVYQEKGRYARAEVGRVLGRSDARVEPPCPHVRRGCGGCGWQHIAPPAQAGLKMAVVRDALRRLGGVAEPQVSGGPVLAPFRYRTTLRVAIENGPALRRRHSHDLVRIDDCLVAHPLLEDLLTGGEFGAARRALLRCGVNTGGRMCVLGPSAEGARFPQDVVVAGEDELSGGRRAWLYEVVAGVRLRISAGSFFQSRPDGAEVLVGLVRDALVGAPAGGFVDAYGGVGLFAATLARGRSPVTIVESSPSAVADAKLNAPGARLDKVAVERWRPTAATSVVADPPRAGLGRRAAEVLAATGASHFALVSCDPASLGRDAKLLASHGFRLRSTVVVDMFPGTPHVEAVSSFVR